MSVQTAIYPVAGQIWLAKGNGIERKVLIVKVLSDHVKCMLTADSERVNSYQLNHGLWVQYDICFPLGLDRLHELIHEIDEHELEAILAAQNFIVHGVEWKKNELFDALMLGL
jgi:hypothetical protein